MAAMKTEMAASRTPITLAAFAVSFAILHYLANTLGWYTQYWWVDVAAHIAGGAWVAWTLYAFRHRIRGYAALPGVAQAIGILAAVALVGVLWEFLEAFTDIRRLMAWGTPLADVAAGFERAPFNVRWDTLADLFNDLVGGALVVIAATLRYGKKAWQ